MTPGDLLTTVPPPAAYPVITALVVLESVLFLSPFVPTLGLLLVAGGLAYAGTLTLPAVIACAAAGAAGFPYRRLAPSSATAGAAWPCTEAGIGYASAATWGQLPGIQDVVLTVGASQPHCCSHAASGPR